MMDVDTIMEIILDIIILFMVIILWLLVFYVTYLT